MEGELAKYYQILLGRMHEKLAIEGQVELQKLQASGARSGLSRSGVHLARLLGTHCEYRIRRPMLGLLACLEEACTALGVEPTEADLDSILKDAESSFDHRVQNGHSFVHDTILRAGMAPGDWATPVTTAARMALADLKRDVELKNLQLRSNARRQLPHMRDQLLEQMSAVNIQSKRVLGYPLFVTTEHQALADVGRTPESPEELSACIQALGILLSQVNHHEIDKSLTALGLEVPEGALNKVQAVLGGANISAEPVLKRLRDVARLRNLYPAHPSNPDAIAASQRIGITVEAAPLDAWRRILTVTKSSLADFHAILLARN